MQSELLLSILSVLILVVVLFGGAMFFVVRQSIYRQAESDLLGAAQLIAQDLRNDLGHSRLAIPQVYQHRFGPAPRDSAYFAIWDRSGAKIAGTHPLPPHVVILETRPPEEGHRPYLAATHGTHLDMYISGPDHTVILVGRPLAREFDDLYRWTRSLTLIGGGCLILGALAGWWLARRIALPIRRLTAAVEQISEKNLHQRLQWTEGNSELVRLALVFDTMLQRLDAAFQRQIQFTADASHELRTPVAVILSQSEQILVRQRTPEEYVRGFETCLRASQRMKRLVDELLLLARVDSGRLELAQDRVDLADVARQALALLEPLAVQRQILLTSQLQSSLVIGDSHRLSQVVTNLVTNALQYNRPQGTVFVSVHLRGDSTVLQVADTGIGIAVTDQAHLLERFYRVERARTQRDDGGSGLGLSIVSEIVTAHRGTIEISSGLNVGTTITVVLPKA